MIKKKILFEKHAPQTRFFMKKNAPLARLLEQNAPQAGFFLTKSSRVLCPVNAVCIFFPRITAQNLLFLIK